MGADGFAKIDETLQDPNCVFQLMKKHYSRYTPEMVEQGLRHAEGCLPQDLRTGRHDRRAEQDDGHLYALGLTEHSNGSQNIRCAWR